jgi:hypothetical protein
MLSVALTIEHPKVGKLVNELERMWKEAVIV